MIEIIPAIDIIDGKCVRLSQGDYTQKKVYSDNPLQVALQFENFGISRLHLVDLDGAKEGKIVNWKILETIAVKTKLIIDFGGGIKTDNDIQSVFDSGANIATIGSLAVKNEELFLSWIKKYGASKILLGADVKNENISINGWQEQTQISVYDFIESNIKKGVSNIFCTDISKDGLLEGASVELYRNILNKFPELNLIASGGVSSLNDIDDLEKSGCSAVIIGKAIYEEKISLNDLKKYVN